MSLYNANGEINLTSVVGSSYTGRYAADGSWNIVLNTSTSPVGISHACGAINAFVVTDPSSGFYAANGSMNVISNGSDGYVPVQPSGPTPITQVFLLGLLDNDQLLGLLDNATLLGSH